MGVFILPLHIGPHHLPFNFFKLWFDIYQYSVEIRCFAPRTSYSEILGYREMNSIDF